MTTKDSNKHLKNELFRFRWSPLFETSPIGGPLKQNAYINAVLVIDGIAMESVIPSEIAAIKLLNKFLRLEKELGRSRESPSIRWGPRELDIDLLIWGDLQVKSKQLTLPHPRIVERSFVVTPLAEAISSKEKPHKRVLPQAKWPE